MGMFTHQVGEQGRGACLSWAGTPAPSRPAHTRPRCRPQVGDVVIIHTHGPKPEMALCVIE